MTKLYERVVNEKGRLGTVYGVYDRWVYVRWDGENSVTTVRQEKVRGEAA